jgi:TPR repeat protein
MCSRPPQAAEWLEKAAHQGNKAAQVLLGRAHMLGLGVEKNLEQAVYWFRMAGGQGVPQQYPTINFFFFWAKKTLPVCK